MAVKQTAANRPQSVAQLAVLVKALPNQNAQYPSAAALFAAAHPFTTKGTGQQARQQLRNMGQYVGRGRRHAGLTPKHWLAQYAASQSAGAQRTGATKAATAQAAKPAKASRTQRKAAKAGKVAS
jgi:hypothetical protein